MMEMNVNEELKNLLANIYDLNQNVDSMNSYEVIGKETDILTKYRNINDYMETAKKVKLDINLYQLVSNYMDQLVDHIKDTLTVCTKKDEEANALAAKIEAWVDVTKDYMQTHEWTAQDASDRLDNEIKFASLLKQFNAFELNVATLIRLHNLTGKIKELVTVDAMAIGLK